MSEPVRWSTLEARLSLSELPAFHRTFLRLHRPELPVDELPLRRVHQYVQQTLHRLVREGQARRLEDDFELLPEAIPAPYRRPP